MTRRWPPPAGCVRICPSERRLTTLEGHLKFGVIVFPGSNCDGDAYHVLDQVFDQPVEYIWHQDTDLSSFDCIILPGGFSYGDYLRAGAIARFSPIMRTVEQLSLIHISEPTRRTPISYAVFCLKKKKQ